MYLHYCRTDNDSPTTFPVVKGKGSSHFTFQSTGAQSWFASNPNDAYLTEIDCTVVNGTSSLPPAIITILLISKK